MKQTTKNILYPLIAILILLPWALVKCERNKNQELKYENKKLEINVSALADTVRVTKDKNDELEFNRKSFVTDRISELETLNADLAAELKATKGKPLFITKTGAKITIHDTIPGKIDTVQNGNLVIGIDFDTTYSPGNSRRLQGTVTLDSQKASADIKEDIYLSATTGLKKNDNGDYEIFFRSDYPNLIVTSLVGSYIPKNQINPQVKRKRFSFGVIAGFSPITYSLDTKQWNFESRLVLGVGLTYNLIQF